MRQTLAGARRTVFSPRRPRHTARPHRVAKVQQPPSLLVAKRHHRPPRAGDRMPCKKPFRHTALKPQFGAVCWPRRRSCNCKRARSPRGPSRGTPAPNRSHIQATPARSFNATGCRPPHRSVPRRTSRLTSKRTKQLNAARLRPRLLLISLLCGGVWLACHVDQVPSVTAELWPVGRRAEAAPPHAAGQSLENLRPQPPRGWRRTAQGWQRADAWQPFPVAAGPSLHPLTVALLELLLSLAALVAWTTSRATRNRQRPAHPIRVPFYFAARRQPSLRSSVNPNRPTT